MERNQSTKGKAIWFSQSQPTAEQISEARVYGYDIVAVEEGIGLGGVGINDWETLEMVMDSIKGLLFMNDATAIFGVFPVPVLAYMRRTELGSDGSIVSCYSSWNVSRTPEGGRPTSEHKEWCLIGVLRF